ncbi:MAG: HAMP domain-containing sensor histidine kinase [Caulobacteraceae bacterium]|nr:HAMP domain-containing sensor histidine kinase [Caulobacteraceae bacterium]
MRWPASSLRLRLLAALLFVWVMGAAVMTVQFLRHEREPDEVLEDASLSTQARALIGALRFDSRGAFVSVRVRNPWRRAYRKPNAAYYTIYDPQGRPVARSPNLTQPLAPIPLAAGEAITAQRLVGPDQDLAAAARAPGGYVAVVARANPGRADQTPRQKLVDLIPGMIFGLSALLGLVVVWLVAAWSLRPLARAAREAALIGPEHPDARLSTDELPGEVRPLAEAVNRALDRVSEAYANEKRFTAEAAHALRTPLTVLDLRLQRAEQGGQTDWPSVRADVAELTRVVSSLLTLSKAERERVFRAPAQVNLTRLAREAAAAFAPRLEADGRTIEITAPDEPILLHGEAGELREMVFALIDNALTHGRGRVLLTLSQGSDVAVLEVSDDGPGVAEAEREQVFERFHKLDGASPGAGLGLAIVRQTARNHGGDARFIAASSLEIRLARTAP